MNPRPPSFWNQLQLVSLRLLSGFLGVVDSLFDVRWGERLLDRMGNRWRSRLLQLDDDLARLEEERSQLQLQAQALSLHGAAIYLGGRKLARNELRFDPTDPHDEEILDASIDLLVKERLASIEMEEIQKNHYVYCLEPDWKAIRARLDDAAGRAGPEVAGCIHETIRFIDDAFLSEPAASKP
jgi:hypothetical protein